MLRSAPLLVLASYSFGLAQPTNLPAAAQKDPPAKFDVVSVKLDKTDGIIHSGFTADGYSATHVSLRMLIMQAYGIPNYNYIVDGPSWQDANEFDVETKFDPNNIPAANTESRRAMLEELLADRFGLKVHHEDRNLPAYNLVIAKGGSKLEESAAGRSCRFARSRPGEVHADGCPIKSIGSWLQTASGRRVLDKTGLTGNYHFDLHWTPDNTPQDSPAAGGPSIFTAVQDQLGLKLEPATASLDVLVVDAVQQPSGN